MSILHYNQAQSSIEKVPCTVIETMDYKEFRKSQKETINFKRTHSESQLLKKNAKGELLKTIDLNQGNTCNRHTLFYTGTQTNDGGYVIVGIRKMDQISSGENQLVFQKRDSILDLILERTIEQNEISSIYRILEDETGYTLLVKTSEKEDVVSRLKSNSQIVKLDFQGDLKWQENVGLLNYLIPIKKEEEVPFVKLNNTYFFPIDYKEQQIGNEFILFTQNAELRISELPIEEIDDVFSKDGKLYLKSKNFLNHIDFKVVDASLSPSATIEIYPNPTEDKFFIYGKVGTKLKIFSLNGLHLKDIVIKEKSTEISLKEFEDGIYILKGDSSPVLKKIVKISK